MLRYCVSCNNWNRFVLVSSNRWKDEQTKSTLFHSKWLLQLVRFDIKVSGWTYQISEHLIFLHKSKRWLCILQIEVSIKDSFLYTKIPCFLVVESLKRSNVHFITHSNAPVTVDAAGPFADKSRLWLKKKNKNNLKKSLYPPTFGANAIQKQAKTAREERAATVWHWLDYSLRKISGLDTSRDGQKANELQQARGQTMERVVPTKCA